MKIKQFCIAVLLGLGTITSLYAQTYNQLWKQVDQAKEAGKPQTAIGLTSDIFRKAETEKNSPQMLKAYTERSELRERLAPDSFYVDLKGMEQWATATDKPLDRAVLHSLIAEVYADYASQNAWQLQQRTDIVQQTPPDDIREWSLNLFLENLLKHTREALKDTDLLLKSSALNYIPFVEKGESSVYFKHDMLHLLGSRAIQSLNKVRFVKLDSLCRTETENIYQQMMSTYRSTAQDEAFVMVALDYLKWKYKDVERGIGAEKSLLGRTQNPYLVEINKLISQFKSKEICSEIYLVKAEYAVLLGEKPMAVQLCDEAIGLYPNYKRINALKVLKQDILRPQLNVHTPQVTYPGSELTLNVSHQNLGGFTIRFYRVKNLDVSLRDKEINEAFYKSHTNQVSEQYFSLVRSANYQSEDTVFTIKAPNEGAYVMRIIPDEKTSENIGQFMYVTRFMLITRTLADRQVEILTLDSKTGHPIPQATVVLATYDNKLTTTLTTDAEGKVLTAWGDIYNVRAHKGKDQYMPFRNLNRGMYYSSVTDKQNETVKLFTDRGLYRPGQMVYVKGIAYRQQTDTARVVAGKAYTLMLFDVNDQEVARADVSTNEMGSFTASFALPSVCLNGFFTLKTEKGMAQFKVEEYKRPTFDLTFDKLEGTYRLGDKVELKGKAQTFSGVPMQGLEVKYTVNRSSGFGWQFFIGSNDLMDSGSATLQTDGSFVIPVKLEAMHASARKMMNWRFKVEATITNEGGETQSSSYTLSVGEQSLFLETDLDQQRICKDKEIKTTFKAFNLDRQPVNVEGTYTLYPQTDAKDKKYAKEAIYSGKFTSNREVVLTDWQSLSSGAYQLVLLTRDASGREVKQESTLELFSLKDTRPAVETPLWYYEVNTEFDAVHPAVFHLGTSFKDTYVLMSTFSKGKTMETESFVVNDSILRFEYPYKEEYADGLVIQFCFIKEGELHQQTVTLQKRVFNKELKLKWEVFRDKLRPGQQEEWKLTVKTSQGTPANAELLALMYDASLDKIWMYDQAWAIYYGQGISFPTWNQQYSRSNGYYFGFPGLSLTVPGLVYDSFWSNPEVFYFAETMEQSLTGRALGLATRNTDVKYKLTETAAAESQVMKDVKYEEAMDSAPALRTNFAETAFFYPQLRTNEQGEVSFSFTLPESLTRWKFQGIAHTQGMLTGMLTGEATTSKEFMLTPNLPRFVREGDHTSIAASVTNLTGNALSGTVSMELFNPMTEKIISTHNMKFAVEAGRTTAVSFLFTATDKYDVLGCRLIADAGTFSDGEQHLLPVLSNKEVLTESVVLPVRGQTTKTFSIAKLFNNQSKSATNRQLTVEFTANLAWYAVQALPMLNQPTNDNAVSWATAYYANTLAAHIMNSQPRIKAVFDSWKMQGGTKEAFLSNLQKNQEVKNILLSESPWVMEAKNEEQQKERIATLFDLNATSANKLAAQTKLQQLQLPDGSYPWFKGMSGSPYITTYIASLNARLASLIGQPLNVEMAGLQKRSLIYLNREAKKEYDLLRKLEKEGKKVNAISLSTVDYLYVQALSDNRSENDVMEQYFLSKASQMLASSSMPVKAKLAVIFQKAGRPQEAQDFMVSLKEHLTKSDEMGLYFAFNENPYSWGGQQIPAHVAVMDAFDKVNHDASTVEEMKLWLLKQKQTQQWDSPVASADAIYALLYCGVSQLNHQGGVRIAIGDKVLNTEQSRMAGVGYVKEVYTDRRTVEATQITVAKSNGGVSWGAAYARFEENTDRVQQQGGELNVDKKLYVERLVKNDRKLELITGNTILAVGDKVVSRITIHTDRAMEFVQLKDQRGACFEPIGNLSGYRWNNGLGYYIDVKDASTLFFFDGLGKGVFVLESSYRVNRTGTYDAGLATIQCAYAPEYSSHSGSIRVVSK